MAQMKKHGSYLLLRHLHKRILWSHGFIERGEVFEALLTTEGIIGNECLRKACDTLLAFGTRP